MAEGPMLGRTVRFQGVLPNGEQASFSGVVSMEGESGSQVGVQIYGYPALCWLPASQVETVAPDVETSVHDLIEHLRDLNELANYGMIGGSASPSAARLGALGIRPDDEGYEAQAADALDAMLSAVEATTTFEVILGADGPDRRLCFECDRVEMNSAYVDQVGTQLTYEIRRVLYRCTENGSAEIELTGADREVAEAFGRRVVPELGE